MRWLMSLTRHWVIRKQFFRCLRTFVDLSKTQSFEKCFSCVMSSVVSRRFATKREWVSEWFLSGVETVVLIVLFELLFPLESGSWCSWWSWIVTTMRWVFTVWCACNEYLKETIHIFQASGNFMWKFCWLIILCLNLDQYKDFLRYITIFLLND